MSQDEAMTLRDFKEKVRQSNTAARRAVESVVEMLVAHNDALLKGTIALHAQYRTRLDEREAEFVAERKGIAVFLRTLLPAIGEESDWTPDRDRLRQETHDLIARLERDPVSDSGSCTGYEPTKLERPDDEVPF